MPIYEYEAADPARACVRCRTAFEHFHRAAEPPLAACPHCGAAVRKLISAPAVGGSRSGFDDRARHAGFHKLKRTGKGEYEKMY
jgi:putative FmdB family regulatory protein